MLNKVSQSSSPADWATTLRAMLPDRAAQAEFSHAWFQLTAGSCAEDKAWKDALRQEAEACADQAVRSSRLLDREFQGEQRLLQQ